MPTRQRTPRGSAVAVQREAKNDKITGDGSAAPLRGRRPQAVNFTQEASLAEIHVAALQTTVAMPGGDLITPVTGDVHI